MTDSNGYDYDSNRQHKATKEFQGFDDRHDMVSTLRAADETKRISAALALLGAVMVVFGLAWGLGVPQAMTGAATGETPRGAGAGNDPREP
jgi:hypothetical protein